MAYTTSTEVQSIMRYRNIFLFCICAALLLTAIGCTKAVDVAGNWSGKMSGANAGKTGSAVTEAKIEQNNRGITGTIDCKSATGAWDLLDGNTLRIQSSTVKGNAVSFVAVTELPGGNVNATFKGTAEGSTLKGEVGVTIGSVMGGNTYLGEFEFTRK
jgi:hypothetical protein